MTTKVNLIIQSLDQNGKKVTDTIMYVNPEATDSQLTSLAQRLNALSDNSYIQASKVTTEVLTNE